MANSYAHLRRQAVDFVARYAAAGPVLVLAPMRAAADEVALEACTGALMGVQRLAFREFVLQLSNSELNRRALIPVGRFVREALAARVTAQAIERGVLTYLRPVAGFPGFPRALTATFEELRLNPVDPDRLRACGESGPDLAYLLDAYSRELGERRFADHAARVELARDAFSASYNALRQTAVVTLDLAPRSALERELLASVMGAARTALELRIAPDTAEPTTSLESRIAPDTAEPATSLESRIAPDTAEPTTSLELRIAPDTAEPTTSLELPIAPDTAEPATSLESLQRYLFSNDPVPVREEDGSVVILSTSGEALECVEIARAIHAAAAEGVPFDRMAILLRSPERHQPLVLEALRRAGLPVSCTLGARRPDAAGRSLLALLYCAEEGLSASRFAEYLSLGQMPDDEEPVTPALWERLLVDAAVIGGVARWETRLAGLREEFHRRHAGEEDEAAREFLAGRILAVENLARLALPMIARLDALPKRALWGEWIDTLIDLSESALREPERAIEILEELEPMSEIGPVSLAEVLLVLGPRLNSSTAAAKESRFGKVWLGSVEEARGMAFRRVFLPGVNEGLFPRPPAEDPLLLHAQRSQLGIELRAEDTELLGIAVACASERLHLSFSRLDLLTGRERVPSFYAFAAHRAAGGSEIDVREFESRARSATRTRIGWPAPSDAGDAIDDAEFDLATLAPRAAGSGQYLKSLPGRSVESLRARWARWHKAWKAADGLLVEEIGSDALSPYLLAQRPWSPSVLQQYARCPYRFALRGIFGLRAAEQPTGVQRMDPATRGELYHAVQFELLRAPDPLERLDEVLDRLDDVLESVAARFEADLAPAIPQIWRAGIAAIRADLRGWLQQRASRESDWMPQFAELSFGLRDPLGHDPRSRKEAVAIEGGFQLQGSIDLVERHTSGILRVVDHKTGRVPEPRPEIVGLGEVLQPALYALAAEEILGEPVAFGRLYYSTIAQNYATVDVQLNDWARQRALQVLRAIDEAMLNGFLPAAPRKDGCKRCEYLTVCGPYEEERVGEKSQPELKTLKELRTWR